MGLFLIKDPIAFNGDFSINWFCVLQDLFWFVLLHSWARLFKAGLSELRISDNFSVSLTTKWWRFFALHFDWGQNGHFWALKTSCENPFHSLLTLLVEFWSQDSVSRLLNNRAMMELKIYMWSKQKKVVWLNFNVSLSFKYNSWYYRSVVFSLFILPALYRGYYTAVRRYEFYFRVVKTILWVKYCFLPQENKIHIFKPPCNFLFIL